MVIPISHREGRWASGHDLCPSIPEKVRSVAMAMPITLRAGMRERGHDLCLSPLEEKEGWGQGHPRPTSKGKVGKWP